MTCVQLIYLPKKVSPGYTEFCHSLIMSDFPQRLCSRVPSPHPVPPWSLALYYGDVSQYGFWMPPCTLLIVLFEWSYTYTINTCISHIFDMHTIYSYNLMTIQCIKYIHTYVQWIPWTISWWGYRGSMKCDFSCSPPLRWLPHLLLLVTLPRSHLGSRHWTKIF